MEQILDTKDNGENVVQVATIGKVVGKNPVDGSPIEQNLTEESLQKMAEVQKDTEILVDADHESEIGDKTEAKGWLSKLFVKPGVGLFGTIKWTDIGKKLIENRVFRWLSPSWVLDKETKEPMFMTSVALTNKPSQIGEIQPIVNSAPVMIENTEEGIPDMTKEELKQLIKDAIAEIKKDEAVENVEAEIKDENEFHKEIVESLEEKKDAIEAGDVQPEEVVNEAPKAEETACNACGEETKEAANEQPKEEEKKDDDDDDDDDKEVIKIEALNSAPKTAGLDVIKDSGSKWQALSGKEFIDWVNNGCK